MKSHKINLKLIKSLKPCQNRLDNYIKFYGDRDFTLNQFMGLKNITLQDKLWVAFRLMPRESIGKAAGEIALSVLPIYEKQYPNDYRPRKAIEACIAGTMTPEIQKDALSAYVAAVVNSKTCFVPDVDYSAHAASSAYAAASVYCCGLVVYEIVYSNIKSVLYAAIDALKASANKKDKDKLIRKICIKYWKKG